MIEEPIEEVSEDVSTDIKLENKVILYNDSWHTFEEVTTQIMLAISCSEEKAFKIAYTVDRNGSAVVYAGGIEECLRVSGILQNIDLKTEIVS